SFSGRFDAGTGKQYNIGRVSGEHIHLGTDDNVLSSLVNEEGAAFNSREREHEPCCLPGTRTSVLKAVTEWADSPAEAKILWLNGWVGTGKSTIARTVARDYHNQSRLAASYFFGDRRADYFVTTIALQLANMDPGLRQSIEDSLRRHPLLRRQSLSEQWRRLVLEPLVGFLRGYDGKPMLLVVDGLDLCQEENDIGLIVKLLFEACDACGDRMLVFLSTRPEASIRDEIACIEHREVMLQREDASTDISLFLSDELSRIAVKVGTETGWPGKETIANLVTKSDGIFAWAATVCQYIRDGRNKTTTISRLHGVLQHRITNTSPQGKLDQIYTETLNRTVRSTWDTCEVDEYCHSLRETLGFILILQSPLSVDGLNPLLGRDDAGSILGDLHSILEAPAHPDKSIRLHHYSFCDFMLSEERCPARFYLGNQMQQHRQIAERCLDIMAERPEWNDDSNGSQSLTVKMETPELQQSSISAFHYACCYWVHHAQRGKIDLTTGSRVNLFVQKYMQKW
ncbi:hypothetical protein BO70DRAFT_273285, partial [Aspergillus heteromorphus CBS 117.55]